MAPQAARPPCLRRRTAGFTIIEMVFTIAIFSAISVWFARTLTATTSLSADSVLVLRAQEEHRRNLDSLANALRGASYASLTGFDATGTSTAPGCSCATGYEAGGAVLDAPMQLSWQATKLPVRGVTKPGEVVGVQGGVTKKLATRVPSGGFKAILVGNTMRIQLTTYYSTSAGKTVTVSGEASVSLRN